MNLPFEIKYDIRLEELQIYSLRVMKKKLWFWPAFILIPLAEIIWFNVLGTADFTIYIHLVVPILMIGFIRWRLNKSAEQQYISRANQFKNITLIFTEDTVTSHTDGSDSTQKWSNFIKVSQDKDFVVLQQTKILANIIPRRCFENEMEIGKFMNFAIRKIKEN